jgi:hypothetical protein
MAQTKRQSTSGAAKTSKPSQPPKPDPRPTVHIRITPDEKTIGKDIADQTQQTDGAIFAESISYGLFIVLIKAGPDINGLYVGRWTAKELAQLVRRKFGNELIDFQFENGELPSFLRDYLKTLKTLAEERPSGAQLTPGSQSLQPGDLTEEDAMVFSSSTDADGVKQSLGSMGFGMLGLNHTG